MWLMILPLALGWKYPLAGFVVPLVIITGLTISFFRVLYGDKEKARRMGIDGYMMKPVIQRQLAQTLHDVLEKKGGSGPAE